MKAILIFRKKIAAAAFMKCEKGEPALKRAETPNTRKG
jgi:hypothetical protein